jgi:HK97 family phage major capsid protein
MTIKQCKKRLDEINEEIKEITKTGENAKRELTEDEQSQIDTLMTEKEEIIVEIEQLIDTIEEVNEANSEEHEPEKVEEAGRKKIVKNLLNRKTKISKNYNREKASIATIIRKKVLGRSLNDAENELLNIGRNEMSQSGIAIFGDLIIPTKRAYQATLAPNGIDDVATELQDIVQPSWAKLVLKEAGATFYSGLVGNQQFPLMSQTNVDWQTETGAAIDGGGDIKSVTFSPKRLTAYVDISRQMLIQDNSGNLETYLTNNIINAISNKLEQTLLGNGSASATQPRGLFNYFTINPLTPTFEEVVDLEGALEGNDIHGNLTWITNPFNKSKFKTTPIANGSGIMIQVNNEINGYKAYSTSNSFGVALGDFSKYVVCNWGGTEITIDPYSRAINGCVRLVVNTYWDGGLLYNNNSTGQKPPIVLAGI